MQGFARALQEDYADRLDAEAKNYTNRIINAARRMDELILDLLAYSRLTRSDLILHPTDLWAVVKETKQQLDTVLREAGATI